MVLGVLAMVVAFWGTTALQCSQYDNNCGKCLVSNDTRSAWASKCLWLSGPTEGHRCQPAKWWYENILLEFVQITRHWCHCDIKCVSGILQRTVARYIQKYTHARTVPARHRRLPRLPRHRKYVNFCQQGRNVSLDIGHTRHAKSRHPRASTVLF